MSHFKKTATSSLQTMTHKNKEKRNGEEREKREKCKAKILTNERAALKTELKPRLIDKKKDRSKK